LKLLRALRSIDADYVILDLGGDTTHNILDFFLAADQGLVLTTCDPASYMDAYGFTKMALHRKLVRLFGAESAYRQYRDVAVEKVVKEFVYSTSGETGSRISDLVARLQKEKPVYGKLVTNVLERFQPGIVVTMSEGPEQVAELVARLQKVSAKMLSIQMNYLGDMPYASAVRDSARNLVPCVAGGRTARWPGRCAASCCRWRQRDPRINGCLFTKRTIWPLADRH